jgi:hypothetical protein
MSSTPRHDDAITTGEAGDWDFFAAHRLHIHLA